MNGFLLFILSATLLLGGCKKTETTPAKAEVHLQVFVKTDGTIVADGSVCDLANLAQRMDALKQEKGVVWYSRANPEGEPHPQAMEVMKLVADRGLPVSMFKDEAFTQIVTFK